MPGDVPTQLSLPRRAGLYARLVYKEIQYWLVGLTPEHYHHYQAVVLSELLRFDGAIKHYKAFLELTDEPRVRGKLGLLLGTVSRWPEALTEFERAAVKWQHPVVRLAIVEAHIRLGNIAEAARLIGLVSEEDCHESEPLGRARSELLAEIEGATAHVAGAGA